MVSLFADVGDTFVSTVYSDSSLRVHAETRPDGTVALLYINDGVGSSQDRTLTTTLNGAGTLLSTGTLYLFGNANISGSNSTAPTTQTLSGLSSTFSVTIPNQTIGTLIIPAISGLSWNNVNGAGDGNNWDSSNQNWMLVGAPATFNTGADVTFNDRNNSHYGVTLNGTVMPHSVTVNNSAGDYTISGGGNIAGTTSLTKTGTRTLTLSTANSYTGGTTVNGGKLVVAAGGALGNGPIAIGASGDIQLGANTGLATTTSLSIASGGVLDVNNNHMIISYAAGTQASVDATVRGYLINGYAGGNWNGPGIDSSAVVAGSSFGVGYADGADGVVAGLSSGQIEVKYTLLGDANLDGLVSGDDFTILVGNLGKSVTAWDRGDFLYTGTVTGDDFTDLVANLGKQANGADVALSAGDHAAVDAFAAANGLMADVPEPGSMVSLVAGAAMLATRRRAS